MNSMAGFLDPTLVFYVTNTNQSSNSNITGDIDDLHKFDI